MTLQSSLRGSQFKVNAKLATPRKPSLMLCCAVCIVLFFLLYTSACMPSCVNHFHSSSSHIHKPLLFPLLYLSPPIRFLFASLFCLCCISVRFECRNNVYLYVGPCWLCIINSFGIYPLCRPGLLPIERRQQPFYLPLKITSIYSHSKSEQVEKGYIQLA